MKSNVVVFFLMILMTNLAGQSEEELKVIQFHQEIYNGLLDEFNTPNYLYPIVRSDSLIQVCENTMFESLAMQSLAWYYSYVGEYKKSLELFSNTLSPIALSTKGVIPVEKYKPVNAKEYIADCAKDYNYVLINEAHHKPLHRVFASSLLDTLSGIGFNVLAAETIGLEDTIVNTTKIPDENLGGLTMEPNYSNLIRVAVHSGYHLLPYDYNSDFDFVKRDSVAALRIVDFKKNHKGKVLIYCGFEHIDETQKSLAYWVQHFTGEEVLTINQTRYCEEAAPKFESPYFQMATALNAEEKSPYVLKRGKTLFKEFSTSDLFVFHPRTDYRSGRESWLTDYELASKRRVVNLPDSIMENISSLSILQVFHKLEYPIGIPIDQILLTKNDHEGKAVVIPEGEFVLTIEDADRNSILKANLVYTLAEGLTLHKVEDSDD